jgi:prepilin-type N-terminal cleavage/methylation domain-containing protein
MLNSRNLNHLKGFTLLEMIISIGIFVLVATASSVLFNQALNAYRYTTSRMAAAREASLAMDWIVREIRPNPNTGIVLPISTGGGLVSDGVQITLDVVPNAIHYHLHADGALNTIQRETVDGLGNPHALLARNVDSLIFGYFDADNEPVGALDDAKTVEIIIRTRVNEQEFRLYRVIER